VGLATAEEGDPDVHQALEVRNEFDVYQFDECEDEACRP
jgi:hypothetical protein